MLNLETLFKNYFARKDTGAKYIAYFSAISDEDVTTAVRQALTVNVDAIISEFKALVSRREGAVRDAFGKMGAAYQEFFPHGLSEYSNATKENIETLMSRLETVSTDNAASLSANFAAQWTDILTRYRAARSAQLGKKGEVAMGKELSAGARTALELQLIGNIHFIGWKWPGDVSKTMGFFDQSFIHDQHSGGSSAATANGK